MNNYENRNTSGPFEIIVSDSCKYLFMRWRLRAILDLSIVLSKNHQVDRYEFMKVFIKTLGRISYDKYDGSIESFKEAHQIENVESLSESQLNFIADEYLKEEVDALTPSVNGGENGRRESRVKDETYAKRRPSETPSQHLKRLVESSMKRLNESSQEFFARLPKFGLKTSTKEKLFRDDLIARSASETINVVRGSSLSAIDFKLPTNPVNETNKRLERIERQMANFILLMEAQCDITKALNSTTQELLADSAASSRQAKRGVYVAVLALFFSVIIGLISISDNRKSSTSTETILMKISASILGRSD